MIRKIQKVPVSAFMTAVASLDGIPYIWGGKDHNGLDCSGLVTFALFLAGGPDLRQTHNADALMRECDEGDQENGSLAFYGPPGKANHVMVADWRGVCYAAYGACGGGSGTTTPEMAKAQHAKVQTRSRLDYRPDRILTGRLRYLDYSL